MSQVSSTVIATTNSWAIRMADSVLQSYPASCWKWHYEHGLVIKAIAAVGAASGENRFHEVSIRHGWITL